MKRQPCDARIRPFMGDTEIACGRKGTHDQHQGAIRDYAYPGSKTEVSWYEGDRRNYHGDWPGRCTTTAACVLPNEHPGRCAT